MIQIARLWRTIRQLRPVQIYGRLWFYLARPRLPLCPTPCPRSLAGSWQEPAQRRPSLTGPGEFRLLNEPGSLSAHGWDNPSKAKLWRYNQHYFDDLNAQLSKSRSEWHRMLIADWIGANPPGIGTGWEPYPTSLRIVNWVKWALAGNLLEDATLNSLAVQARWLARRLEYHLLGNHLFANAKALIFAGLYFAGSEAQGWLDQGLEILKREIPEQILPDGGQFELSPMYHALALEDMLDLINITEAFGLEDLSASWRKLISRMLRWLQTMSHPDDQIAFFNDAAFGIAPSNAQLRDYAKRLNIHAPADLPSLTHLEASGYARIEAGHFTLLVDLAHIGPDYLPGHAHADTLGFELSYAGHRIFVNSGTSEYGNGPERLRQRGTAAHNTVMIEGRNSSEVWSGFRVGRRARPQAISIGLQENRTFFVKAAHDGYRHLSGNPIVSRSIIVNDGSIIVSDIISTNHEAKARLHLHPDTRFRVLDEKNVDIYLFGRNIISLNHQDGPIILENTTWHPEFGQSIPNYCLVLPLVSGRSNLIITDNLAHENTFSH